MATTYMNRGRGRSISQLSNPTDDELVSIERHYEFVNVTFKNTISDLDYIIQLLRSRLIAEEAYLNALLKTKKLNEDKPTIESKFTFQKALDSYESNLDDIIDSRHILKEKLKLEIDVLVKQKDMEEQNRKLFKSKLYDSKMNYSTFRNRDIIKLQKAYIHKCDELKASQTNWQQQQQPETTESNRNSLEISDSDSIQLDQHWKGVAGLISQMRSKHASVPMDQNKHNTKVARLKKDIIDADNEYRAGIITLETLRKKQLKTADETNRQLYKTIKKKSDIIKTSLMNIFHSEIDSLQQEMRVSHLSYDTAFSIDSNKDLQLFIQYYQSQGYITPKPFRYENYYFEGKCKEVLFGSLLEDYALNHNRTVPLIVLRCCEAIENMGGLQKEGIYRVSGRQSNVEQLKHQFELDEENVELDGYDIVIISTVLKTYLRELRRPLFDFNIQSRASYHKSMPQAQRFQLLETKLANLSLAHRSTLHYIIRHLSKVNAHSQVNKMNISNLAMIFTPVIFHDFNQSDDTIPSDWSPDDLFEDLILNHDTLFPRAEEMARKQNEAKLNQAKNGMSPFNQFSQSNLLYLNPSLPPAMNYYPPKLTTLIGAPPTTQKPS